MNESKKLFMEDVKKIVSYLISFFFLSCTTNNNSVQSNNFIQVQKEKRFYEESGGFSIIPPETWQIDEISGLQYKIILGPKGKDSSNITFATETFDGQLNIFVDNAIASLNSLFGGNISLIQRSKFFTLKNIIGEKIIIHTSMQGQNFRQFIYFLSGNDNIIIAITCTTLAETSYDYYNEMFDKTVKTFEWTDGKDRYF